MHPTQVKGETYQCGYVDMGSSDRTHVRIAVLVFKGGRAAGNAPIVELAGGPSQSWSNLGLDRIERSEFANADRDYVFAEQRGTGLSEPSLVCRNQNTLGDCYNELTAKHVHTEDFNTRLLADDVERVRMALGYRTMIPLGTSYGTTWARGIIARHPDSVERVVLNSPVIANVPLLNRLISATDEAFTNLFKACASDAECNAFAPDLESRMIALMERLKSAPLKDTQGNVVLDNVAFAYATRALLSSKPDEVPAFIVQIEGGTGPLEVDGAADAEQGNEAIAQYYSVFCGDNDNASTAGIDSDLKRVRPAFAETLGPAAYELREVCAAWPHGDGSINSLLYPGPSLLLVGEFDPRTPPSFARDTIQALKNGQVVVVPGKGHDVASSSMCTRSIVSAFVNGNDTPNTSCLAELRTSFTTQVTREAKPLPIKRKYRPIDLLRY